MIPSAHTPESPVPVEPMLEWFAYDHLPEGPLRDTSSHFHALAHNLTLELPRSPERTVALRKLLESKDAAVRCAVHEARAAKDPIVGKERDRVDSPDLAAAPAHD